MSFARRVVIVLVPALLASGLSIGTAEAKARAVTVSALPDAKTDAAVYLAVDGTRRELAAMRSRIASSPLVAEYAYVSKNAAYRIAKQHDIPVTSSAELPAGFRVRLLAPRKSISKFVASVHDLKGLTSVVAPKRLSADHGQCSPNGATVGVNLSDNATPSATQAAQAAISSDPDVASVTSVSSEQALAIYQCIIRPGIDLTATAEQFPPELRVTPRPGADTAALRSRLQAVPGVNKVT